MVKLCIGDFPLISAGRALRPVITGPKKIPCDKVLRSKRRSTGKWHVDCFICLRKRRQVYRDTRDLLANNLL
jgi:hypothetical protein